MTSQPNTGPDIPTSGPQFLIIGQILRAHGIRGDLSVKMLTAFPERMTRLDTIYLTRDPENPSKRTQHEVTTVRHAKNDHWLLHFAGINGRDEAEILRGLYILVSLKDAVPLEEDEVYLFQVLGLEARTIQGEVLGRVTDIIETGANDVYVINGGPYGEVLLPAISTVIKNIDVDNGAMIVEVPAGLLPDSKEPPDSAD